MPPSDRTRRGSRRQAGPPFDKRQSVRYVGITAFVLLLLALPQFGTGSDLIFKNLFISTAIVALGLDVLVGRTGQLSLCQGALFGTGCFTAVQVAAAGAPWPIAFVGAVAFTAVVSTIVGLPSLRIRGLQVAVATLAFQIFLISLSSTKPEIKGITTDGIARPDYLLDDKRYYYFGLVFLGLTVLLVNRVRTTRAGRMFVSVRDVEERSGSFGIASGPAKLLAYALAGGIAGLGGALYALQIGTPNDVSPFNLQASLILVAITVIGGAMSSMGIIVAAFFFAAFPSLHYIPTDKSTLVQVIFALLLIVNVLIYPRGIGGSFTDTKDQLNKLFFGPAPRPSPRPEVTDAVAAAANAVALRKTPRPLRERMPTSTLLVARDVTVQYGGVRALDHFNAEVRRGEIVGLIGANGAGKSTFFNAVSGLAPVTGSIVFRGKELVGAPPAIRSKLGLARTWQDMGLVRADTVRENLLLAQSWMTRYPAAPGLLGLFSALPDERMVRNRADLALELFGLTHLRNERLGDLPYGTMRTVEIAAAVSSGPDLLLLDEASAGLTPEEAHNLGDRFSALRDELGLTLVVIEHHVPLIAGVCDYCYCLESGALIAEGTPAEVTAQPRVVESFLGKGSINRNEDHHVVVTDDLVDDEIDAADDGLEVARA